MKKFFLSFFVFLILSSFVYGKQNSSVYMFNPEKSDLTELQEYLHNELVLKRNERLLFNNSIKDIIDKNYNSKNILKLKNLGLLNITDSELIKTDDKTPFDVLKYGYILYEEEFDTLIRIFSGESYFINKMPDLFVISREKIFPDISAPQDEINLFKRAVDLFYGSYYEYTFMSTQSYSNDYINKYGEGVFIEQAKILNIAAGTAYKIYSSSISPEKGLELIEEFIDTYPNSQFLDYALFLKGFMYYNMAEYHKCIEIYTVLVNSQDEKIKEESSYLLSITNFLNGNLTEAQNWKNIYLNQYTKYIERFKYLDLVILYKEKQYLKCLEEIYMSYIGDYVISKYLIILEALCFNKLEEYGNAEMLLANLSVSPNKYSTFDIYEREYVTIGDNAEFIRNIILFKKGDYEELIYNLNNFNFRSFSILGYMGYLGYAKAMPEILQGLAAGDNLGSGNINNAKNLLQGVILTIDRSYFKELKPWARLRVNHIYKDVTALDNMKIEYIGTKPGMLAAYYSPVLNSLKTLFSNSLGEQILTSINYYQTNYKNTKEGIQLEGLKAIIYVKMKQYDKAEGILLKLAYGHPKTVYEKDAVLYLSEVYKISENWIKYIETAEYYINKFGKYIQSMPAFMTEIALVYKDKIKNNEKAVEIFTEIMDKYPEFYNLRALKMYRGECYFELGLIEKAVEDFKYILSTSHKDEIRAVALHKISDILINSGNYSQALGYLEEIVNLNMFFKEYAYFYTGICLEKTGSIEKAITYYNKIIKDYPESLYAKECSERLKFFTVNEFKNFNFFCSAYNNKISLKWDRMDEYADVITNFKIYRKTLKTGKVEQIALLEKYSSSVDDIRIVYGNKYEYYMTAVSKFGDESPKSKILEVEYDVKPPVVNTFKITETIEGNPVFEWDNIYKNYDIKGYFIERREIKTTEWERVYEIYMSSNITSEAESFKIPEQVNKIDGKEYEYRLGCGYGDLFNQSKISFSSIINFLCNHPQVPEITTARTSENELTITLSFVNLKNNYKPEIYIIDTTEIEIKKFDYYDRNHTNTWDYHGDVSDPENTIPNATNVVYHSSNTHWDFYFYKQNIFSKIEIDTRFEIDEPINNTAKEITLYNNNNKNHFFTENNPAGEYEFEIDKPFSAYKIKLYKQGIHLNVGLNGRHSLMRFITYKPALKKQEVTAWKNYPTGIVLKIPYNRELENKYITATIIQNQKESGYSQPFKLEAK
ncbi:MAG: tetratricopeptide repeat protein [Candidatus Muiribacteriota bacterium]